MTSTIHRNYQRRNLNRLVTPAPLAHPHARLVFALMREQRVRYDDLAERSGVTRASYKAWRRKNKPSLESLSAALGALGWSYIPVPSVEKLPADIASEVLALANRLSLQMPDVFAMLLEVSAYQKAIAKHGVAASWQAPSATELRCA